MPTAIPLITPADRFFVAGHRGMAGGAPASRWRRGWRARWPTSPAVAARGFSPHPGDCARRVCLFGVDQVHWSLLEAAMAIVSITTERLTIGARV